MKKILLLFSIGVFAGKCVAGQPICYDSVIVWSSEQPYRIAVNSLPYSHWSRALNRTHNSMGLVLSKEVQVSATAIRFPVWIRSNKVTRSCIRYAARQYAYIGDIPSLNERVLKAWNPANPFMTYYLADRASGLIIDSSALVPQQYGNTCLLKATVTSHQRHAYYPAGEAAYACQPSHPVLKTTLYIEGTLHNVTETIELETDGWAPLKALLVAENELWLQVKKIFKLEDGTKRTLSNRLQYIKIILPFN